MADNIPQARTWLASLEAEARAYIGTEDSFLARGEKLYTFMHERPLKKFGGPATATSLMKNGEYNCVTSTALYYQLGIAVSVPMIFHATPFHVCPVLEYEGKKVWVELTQPKDGFDREFDTARLVEWLLENKMVTREEFDSKGKEAVCNEFIKGSYQRSIGAVIGYHYYNYALALMDRGKEEEGFWALAKAHLLDEADKTVNEAFDASFLVVSALPKLSSSYLQCASAYVIARGKDTTVTAATLAAVDAGVENVIKAQRDFTQSDSILSMVERYLSGAELKEKHLLGLRQSVSVNRGLDLSRKGRHKEAFAVVANELAKDSANGNLRDFYAEVGLAYAQKLLTSGNVEESAAVMDTMYRRLPEYVTLRETYARVLVASEMTSRQFQSHPEKSLVTLLKALDLDSSNVYVRESLASVYHELAMSEIRKNNWQLARKQVLMGLKFAPDHQYLKSDLDLLKKEAPRTKK
jgi:tetratricopeptide (TPR) repeat protein